MLQLMYQPPAVAVKKIFRLIVRDNKGCDHTTTLQPGDRLLVNHFKEIGSSAPSTFSLERDDESIYFQLLAADSRYAGILNKPVDQLTLPDEVHLIGVDPQAIFCQLTDEQVKYIPDAHTGDPIFAAAFTVMEVTKKSMEPAHASP